MQDIVHCLYYLYCPLVLKYRRYIVDLNQREISVLDRTSYQFFIAWFNDVKSWDAIQAAIDWLCLGFLGKLKLSGENGSPIKVDALRQLAFEAANAPIELSETSTIGSVTG